MMVYADKDQCTAQGTDRDKNEGKKYSNSAWKRSIEHAVYVMNHWSQEFMEEGEEMFIINNNPVHVNGTRCPSGLLRLRKGEKIKLTLERDAANDAHGRPVIKLKAPNGPLHSRIGRPWEPLTEDNVPGCPPLQNCPPSTHATESTVPLITRSESAKGLFDPLANHHDDDEHTPGEDEPVKSSSSSSPQAAPPVRNRRN